MCQARETETERGTITPFEGDIIRLFYLIELFQFTVSPPAALTVFARRSATRRVNVSAIQPCLHYRILISMAKNTSESRGVRERVSRSTIDHEKTDEKQRDKFLVSYQGHFYDIQDFRKYHPGGRKVFDYFQNRSLDKIFEQNPHSKGAIHLLEDFTVDNREKYQEYESLIDWDTPILHQVGNLGDRYWEWVNLPVNRQIRLFQSNFLEALTITPWYLIPIVWIPLIIYYVHSGYVLTTKANHLTGNTLLEASISYVFGLLLWSILEYTLHRKLFHFKPPTTSKILMSLHFLLHGVHHKAPLDGRRLVFPPAAAFLVATLLFYIYQVFFPQTTAYFIVAGTVTGYVAYDLTHYYLHHGAPKVGTYLYDMKRNHNYHHFLHHDLGFGISSILWDHIFGTTICLRQLTKPIEW
ncbi:fatty acid 2-hydroxylase [Calliopsis andreniformis]|uniref:fatty acid 2-hydroxylase n=1 Tax=Calliopsis andreniformis TaxID=337506 RepID=UPI003FCD4300